MVLVEIYTWLATLSPLQSIFLASLVLFFAFTSVFGWKYFKAIRARLEKLDTSTFFGKEAKDPFRLVRAPPSSRGVDRPVSVVDLNPEFVKKYENTCKMTSLGSYLKTLRPSIVNEELPGWLEGELQAALGLALLRALGPTMGAALLPGTGFLDTILARIARLAISIFASNDDNQSENAFLEDSLIDYSGIPLTLYNISFLSEMNYQRLKMNREENKGPTPWQVLCRGEVAYNPSFGGTLPEEETEKNPAQPDMVPNRFHFVQDWHKTIQKMENVLTEMGNQKGGTPYQAGSRKLPPPMLIDDRLLPDLHLGFGNALSTHTQREILMNRLLSVLLNRLTTNYMLNMKKEEFVVILENGKEIRKPEDLVKAIIDMGHEVEVAATTHVTTFGLNLCLKEEGGSFTQVPLAAMIENGYTDQKDKKAYTALTHGGMNLDIKSGPLLNNVNIQHFIAIEGLCAWASNNNVNVPWIKDIDCGPRLKGKNVLRVIRMASIQALIVTTVSSDLSLPNGGYGLTGVCNDTAAWLEQALFDKTHIYPISLNGRFATHMMRRARELETHFKGNNDTTAVAKSTRALMAGLAKLPSDLTNLPSGVVDQCRRQLHCMHPERPFKLMLQSENVIKSVMEEIIYASKGNGW